jgi:hypothetical protein
MSKYLITETMKQELESLLEHHPTQLMELRMLEPDTTIERLTSEVSRLDLVNFERTTELECYKKNDGLIEALEAENAALKSTIKFLTRKHPYIDGVMKL